MSNSTDARRPAARAGDLGTVVLGDALPAALATYYRTLDAGDLAGAADAFADDAVYAMPPLGHETDPRVVTNGRVDIGTVLAARGVQPFHHVLDLCVVAGDRCLVEGRTAGPDGGTLATFVASATLRGPVLGRYLVFAYRGPIDPVPTAVASTTRPADAAEMVHRYFDELDEGHFDAAVACFSPGVLYSHPPYKHTGIDSDRRVEFRGRDELRSAFEARGRQQFGHEVTALVQRGPHALLEGRVFDLPDGGTGSFVSSLTLDPQGLIERYVSFYCEPGVDP
jgi:ketosteroid isomerase-like protein